MNLDSNENSDGDTHGPDSDPSHDESVAPVSSVTQPDAAGEMGWTGDPDDDNTIVDERDESHPVKGDADAPDDDAACHRSIYDSRHFQKWTTASLLIFFSLFALEFIRSDLWFDEILTITHFGLRPRWLDVFLTYPIANNHILFSFLLWIWLRITDFVISEEVLRFPCLVMALLALSLLYSHGRRLFDNAAGLLLALTLAFSPVYLGFFCQLRGYGLSILLSVMATIGAFYIFRNQTWEGLSLYIPGVLLLPGVVPSNVLVNGSLFLFLNIMFLKGRIWLRKLPLLIFLAIVSAVGMLIYLPIKEKFLKVASTTGGWEVGWQVCAHWGLAIFAHNGLFLAACFCIGRQVPKSEQKPELPADLRIVLSALPVLFVCCVVPIVFMSLYRVPYPRAFLGYLGPLTFCALILYRPWVCRPNKNFYLLIFFILANGVVWFHLGNYFTRRSLLEGHIRQNLIQQFYTRNQDIQQTARVLAISPLVTPRTRIFVDFHFYLSFDRYLRLYWLPWRGRPSPVECLNGGALFELALPKAAYGRLPILILAHSKEHARESYQRTLEVDVQLEQIGTSGAIKIFHVITPRNGKRPFLPRRDRSDYGNIEI